MAGEVSFGNATAWAQLRLRRGWKNILATTAAYAAIVGGLIVASLKLDEFSGPAQILSFWTMALMGLQIGTLVVFGCTAINGAIRKDITSGMIESHRLMNVSAAGAVAGYIVGATCQVVPIAAVNFALGAMTVGGSIFSPRGWLMANAVMVLFSVCAWTATALLVFVTQMGTRLMVGFAVICVIGHAVLPSLLPGLTMAISPIIRDSVFGLVERGQWTSTPRASLFGLVQDAPWDPTYAISISAHCFVGMLCFLGAVRKYRRNDVVAFGPLLGLVLVAAWVMASAEGIRDWRAFEPRWSHVQRIDSRTGLIIALLLSMCVAAVPISGAAWLQTQWRRRQRLNDPALPRRPIPTPLVALAAVGIGLLLPYLVFWEGHVPLDYMVPTALTMVAFLLATSYVIRIVYYARVTRAWIIVDLWFFFTWLGPVVVDFTRGGIAGLENEDDLLSWITGCSPIGTLMYIWTDWDLTTVPGLAFQGFLAATMAALFYGLQWRRKATRAARKSA